MLTCEDCQALLADALYEPLKATDQQQLENHLVDCAQCRDLQQEMRGSVARLQQMEIPYEEAPALDDLWTQLEPRLDRVDARRYRQLHHHQGWRRWTGGAVALAASLVLAVSVVMQTNQTTPAVPIQSGSSRLGADVNAIPTSGATAFHRYLDRAQAVMLLLANAEQTSSGGMPLDPTYAGLMAIEARLLNASQGNALSASQQKLLSDLEFLLLQFANMEEENLAEGLAMLRLYLQENTVLFRMNLARMQQPPQVI